MLAKVCINELLDKHQQEITKLLLQACQTERYAIALGRPRLKKSDDREHLLKYPADSYALNLVR